MTLDESSLSPGIQAILRDPLLRARALLVTADRSAERAAGHGDALAVVRGYLDDDPPPRLARVFERIEELALDAQAHERRCRREAAALAPHLCICGRGPRCGLHFCDDGSPVEEVTS